MNRNHCEVDTDSLWSNFGFGLKQPLIENRLPGHTILGPGVLAFRQGRLFHGRTKLDHMAKLGWTGQTGQFVSGDL